MIKNFFKNIFVKYISLVITILLFVAFSFASSSFATVKNMNVILVGRVTVGFFALASLIPLIAGEFDISLGYMIGACIMVGGKLSTLGLSDWSVLFFTLLTGILLGVFNGFLTVTLNIPSTISTLGSGMIMYSISLGLCGGKSISNVISKDIVKLFRANFLGFNITIWILLLVAVLVFYLLELTPFGKQIYAVGLSSRVSYLAGIRIKLIRMMSFILAGAIIGIGSALYLAKSGNAYPDTGPTYLMPGLATVFLSITTYKIGSYNVPGTVISIFMLGILFNGVNLLGAPFWLESVVNGLILMAVVLMNRKDSRQALQE